MRAIIGEPAADDTIIAECFGKRAEDENWKKSRPAFCRDRARTGRTLPEPSKKSYKMAKEERVVDPGLGIKGDNVRRHSLRIKIWRRWTMQSVRGKQRQLEA